MVTLAQSNNSFNIAGRTLYPLPDLAVIGSTDERRNAYNNLPDNEKKEASEQFESIVKDVIATNKPESSPIDITLSAVNGSGVISDIGASANSKDSSEFGLEPAQLRYIPPCEECEPTPTPTPPPTPSPTVTQTPTPSPTPGSDLDADGFPDDFESTLANGFTPFYFVSGSERSGTGFATFNNSVPQTVSQVFGPTPPISYFRVTPLRQQYGQDGILYGLIRIDYLTLWNRDDGLVTGNLCIGNPFINPLELGGHPLDNERSAFLVAAPVINGKYNPTPQAYRTYSFYTAAHESTFFDQSRMFNLFTPLQFDRHVWLALSRSKHATYTFNPNNFPVFPLWVIVATYAYLAYLYATGQISFVKYLIFLFFADQAFFECSVERFQDQGGTFSNSRINVGELKRTINNSAFINDTQLRNKLNTRLW